MYEYSSIILLIPVIIRENWATHMRVCIQMYLLIADIFHFSQVEV